MQVQDLTCTIKDRFTCTKNVAYEYLIKRVDYNWWL